MEQGWGRAAKPEAKPMNYQHLTVVLASVLLLTVALQAQDTNKTQDTGKTDTVKTDIGKTDTGKTDTGKTDTGKTDTGKRDSGKTDTGKTQESNETVLKAVSLLFLLAVVIESALAIIFNWRPFVETLNARAVRPLISLVVSGFFVWLFDLDLMTTIVNSMMNTTHLPSTSGQVLTAMVLAGGSAGVNNLLVALGFRQKQTPETATPKPPSNKAWIAVRLDRQLAVGQVEVFLGVPPAVGQQPPLAGVIHGKSKPAYRYFFSDPGRFPGYGGHTVPVNSSISLELAGVDKDGQPLSQKWGPCTLADGAIIDLDFKL
jgi:hypothetical protein